MTDFFHQPVLLQSVCSFLDPRPGKRFLDATLGGGGHTSALISSGAQVLALDQDQSAIDHVAGLVALQPALATRQLQLVKSNFIHTLSVCKQYDFLPVDGVLADLGVSSHQLNTSSRGFSHQATGPLDMRMDHSLSVTAGDLVNTLPERDLAHLFSAFGEVASAKALANRLVAHRPFSTTSQIAQFIPTQLRSQVFQALRIAVNDELGALTQLLTDLPDLLAPSGVAVIISFHSLEDRLVKSSFAQLRQVGVGQILTPTPLTPDSSEQVANSRSRSSKLRAFKKL